MAPSAPSAPPASSSPPPGSASHGTPPGTPGPAQRCQGRRPFSLALEGYRGAVLVASHDLPFLRLAGITRSLRLGPGLTVIEPL